MLYQRAIPITVGLVSPGYVNQDNVPKEYTLELTDAYKKDNMFVWVCYHGGLNYSIKITRIDLY